MNLEGRNLLHEPKRGPEGRSLPTGRPGRLLLGVVLGLVVLAVLAVYLFWSRKDRSVEPNMDPMRDDGRRSDEQATPEPDDGRDRRSMVAPNVDILNTRTLILAGVGLAVLSGLILILSAVLRLGFTDRVTGAEGQRPPIRNVTQLPPAPVLQVNPQADWLSLQATEQALLNSYGWIDREAETVRIPIDRAMELLAERGLPVMTDTLQTAPQDFADESGFPPAATAPPEATPVP